jgi:hypothetical protein
MLLGVGRILYSCVGRFLRRANAALGPFINVLDLTVGLCDLLGVLVSLIAHLIDLCLNGSGSVADKVLRGATRGEQDPRNNARGCENASHNRTSAGVHAICAPFAKGPISGVSGAKAPRKDYAIVSILPCRGAKKMRPSAKRRQRPY